MKGMAWDVASTTIGVDCEDQLMNSSSVDLSRHRTRSYSLLAHVRAASQHHFLSNMHG